MLFCKSDFLRYFKCHMEMTGCFLILMKTSENLSHVEICQHNASVIRRFLREVQRFSEGLECPVLVIQIHGLCDPDAAPGAKFTVNMMSRTIDGLSTMVELKCFHRVSQMPIQHSFIHQKLGVFTLRHILRPASNLLVQHQRLFFQTNALIDNCNIEIG